MFTYLLNHVVTPASTSYIASYLDGRLHWQGPRPISRLGLSVLTSAVFYLLTRRTRGQAITATVSSTIGYHLGALRSATDAMAANSERRLT